jgi:hypothetical protein
MHAILMTSASHIQRLNPGSGDDYTVQSAHHLHRSLRTFRTYLSNHTSISNNVDAVIATSLLFIIYSCNTPVFAPASPTIDRFSLTLEASSILFASNQAIPYIVFSSQFARPDFSLRFPAFGPALDLIVMVKTCVPDCSVPDPN